MKKLCLILALLLVPGLCLAGAYKTPSGSVVQKLSLSADASAVALDAMFEDQYLYQVEIYTSADDAVTFTINTPTGTALLSKTTAAATSGEMAMPTGFYKMIGTCTYTLSGLGSGTATIIISTP